jgi:hypothetical protein
MVRPLIERDDGTRSVDATELRIYVAPLSTLSTLSAGQNNAVFLNLSAPGAMLSGVLTRDEALAMARALIEAAEAVHAVKAP